MTISIDSSTNVEDVSQVTEFQILTVITRPSSPIDNSIRTMSKFINVILFNYKLCGF